MNFILPSKSRENKIRHLFTQLDDEAFKTLFWLVFYHEFCKEKDEDQEYSLRKKLATLYGKFYFESSNVEKEIITEYLPFVLGYAVIKSFYYTFPSSLVMFSKAFGIKVFQHIFIELQGVAISDVFIETQLSQIFKEDILKWIDKTADENNNKNK